jgi:hypothetical protein
MLLQGHLGNLQLWRIGRSFLDFDERVGDHHLAHGFISLISTDSILAFVCRAGGRLEGAEEVVWVEDKGCARN